MIPKIIHYCWFGEKPLTPLAQKCVDSWQRVMPDYEIKRWDESNYDFKKNEFMANAYKQKMWGFVPDYARLDIIYNYGGIYFDTDVETLKPFDEFLKYPAFCGCASEHFVALGLGFGAEKGNKVIKDLMLPYENMNFKTSDKIIKQASLCINVSVKEFEEKGLPISPFLQTECLINKYGFKQKNIRQSLISMEIFPSSYFDPKNAFNLPDRTKEAYSVHWNAASWFPKWPKIKWEIVKRLRVLLGVKNVDFLLSINRKFRKILNKKLF